MSVLIATVGGTENVVKLGFRMMENVEKVILVPGKPFEEVMEKSEIKQGKIRADPIQKAYELKKSIEDFGAKVEIYEVNPLDFKECLLRIIELIQEQPVGTDIAVNVTGGTKLLSLAAMNAACMCYCKAFDVQEKGSGDTKVDLPSPNSGYFNDIGDQAKKILLYLLEEHKKLKKPVEEYNDDELKSFINREIALGLGVTSQTITNKLQMMEADGLLMSKKGAIKNSSGLGKSSVKIWLLTDDGRIYATYFSKKNS
jgi:CRISPR-associated protein Csa3